MEKLSARQIQELIEACVNIDMYLTGKQVVELENNGFTVVLAGNTKMERLKTEITNFIIKEFDVETWYIVRKDYFLTFEDMKYIESKARYNG
jgi:hypothetical protein